MRKLNLLTTSVVTALLLGTPAIAQETRTITDLRGEVTVPTEPLRVLVGDGDFVLQPTVALGVEPVGIALPSFGTEYADVVSQRLPANVAVIGDKRDPSYEQVLLLEPDLILMNNDDLPDEDAMYARYTAIAPTVQIDREQTRWKEILLGTAEALGRTERAKELLADYEARLAQVREVIGERAGTASVVRVRGDHLRYMVQDRSYLWDILLDLGFTAPRTQETYAERPFVQVSLERIDILDADLVLILEDTAATGPGGMMEQISGLPAYQAMEGDKVTLSAEEYLFGNILTAAEFLDVIELHYQTRG